jgi:hypothetical protein
MLMPLLVLFALVDDTLSVQRSTTPNTPPAATGSTTQPSPSAIVRKAYRYSDAGWKPSPGTQLVAVDIEFRNFDSGLDLDDVEIIDAATGHVLEAGPEIAFLDSDGRFFAWHKAPPNGPMRPLLIFEIPNTVKAIQLQHWGDRLTPSPVTIAPSGPTLPPQRHSP